MPRKKRRSKSRRIAIQSLYVLIIAALGIGIVVGLQTDQWKEFTGRFSNKARNTDNGEDPENTDFEINEFDRFLKGANEQQLILRSTELVDDNQESVVERLDRQEKKIRIAEKLLSRNRNARSRNFGVSSKLTALQTREWISFDHGLTSDEQLAELLDFSVQHSTSTDSNTKQKAQLGRLSARIIRNLRSTDQEDSTSFDAVLKEFRSLGEQNNDDSDAALILYNYLQRIHLHADPEAFAEFMEAYQTVYGNSEKEQLRKLAENATTEIILAEFYLVDVFESVGVTKADAADALMAQITAALSRGIVSQQGYLRIVRGILDLARLGQYKESLNLSRMMLRRISHLDVFQPLIEKINAKRKQWKLVDEPFSFDAFTSMDGNSFAIRLEEAPVKALMFLTTKSMQYSNDATYFIMQIAGKYIKDEKFCLSVIYIDNGDSVEDIRELNKLAGLVEAVDFAIVDAKSQKGADLVDKLAMNENAPFVVLLDDADRIIAIGIESPDFERWIARLIPN